MSFRITRHSGHGAPADALSLLLGHLEAKRGSARFSKVGAEIRVTLKDDPPISMERDEREEIGRSAVFDIVREVCDGVPELESDWFAVSALR
jgi:hypothetical protein